MKPRPPCATPAPHAALERPARPHDAAPAVAVPWRAYALRTGTTPGVVLRSGRCAPVLLSPRGVR